MNEQKPGRVEEAVVLVTGANRGIGAAFVQELLASGARRVYAAARDPQSLYALAQQEPRLVPLQLDITDDASVRVAAQQATDVTLLINNAGAMGNARLIGADDLVAARNEMEVNYFGLLRMCRAFAPILAHSGGGALINVLSILSRTASPLLGSYSASKAAAFSLTQSIRAELARQGTFVMGVMPGYVDTDMTEGIQAAKITPQEVVQATFAALRAGQEDVYPGERATGLAAMLLQDPKGVERFFAQSVLA